MREYGVSVAAEVVVESAFRAKFFVRYCVRGGRQENGVHGPAGNDDPSAAARARRALLIRPEGAWCTLDVRNHKLIPCMRFLFTVFG